MTHPELVSLSRKELSQALNIHTRTLSRKIEPLDIPQILMTEDLI